MTDQTRAMLEARGVKWELVDLPIDDIDLVASITNQSRAIPIDQETVDRYVAALNDGAEFPPILTRKRKNGPVILGGNHRTRAHIDAGRTTIRAYVVDVSDIVALELSYDDNSRHGLPPTEDERVAHALVLIGKGRSVPSACKTVGIDSQRVYRQQHMVKATKRAAEHGLSIELSLIGTTVWPRLLSLKSDRTFVAVVKATVFHGLGTADVTKLVADLNAVGDTQEQLDLLAVWLERKAEDRGRRRGRPSEDPYFRLRQASAVIRSIQAVDVIDAAGPAATRELMDLCANTARYLATIHDQAKAAARVVA